MYTYTYIYIYTFPHTYIQTCTRTYTHIHTYIHTQEYNPYFLDDPEMRSSKHRTVIKQAGYMVTCIPFVKPKTMKNELNEMFLAKVSTNMCV